jgi:hypothetical protein
MALVAELFAIFHVAKEVRHEAILYVVHAKGNAAVFRRGRSDRVSSCEFFATRQDVLDRKPLPGHESKAWYPLDLEVEMLGEVVQRRRPHQPRRVCLKYH